MRERDLNLNLKDEKELTRIKTILFPKRTKESSHSEEMSTPKSNVDNGVCMRSEIEKLRGEISTLLAKGKGNDFMAINTERAYLDGINRLTKELKNNANQINEVFDQFLAHLPTKLTNELHQYNSHYYFSMLAQNVAWHKIAEVMRKPLLEAFVAIKEESQEKKMFQERVCFVENERRERMKARMCSSMGKYFNIWRFNNKCIEVKLESEEYLRQNNLQNDQRLTHSLLNLPLLVLMLEQLGRQSSDISELLVLDQAREKACKFIEQCQSIINSSIETVTQRSLLQSQRSNMKFSRFDISLSSSLTKQCIESGEILFINNLSKNHDYSQIDNLSYWQSLGKLNTQCLKGGAIFYPIFDIQQHCIGVLRQYFYEGVLTAISNKKLQKICTFLELGLKMEQRTRVVTKEKEYQREGYYMKMIGLVKKMELAEGNEKESMSLLNQQLRDRLGVAGMAIYRVQKKDSSDLKDILLKKLWGESQDCKFLITLVHQLLKQQSNYIYLQNRLVVYSNHTLFDLQLQENLYANNNLSQQGHQNVLPIDLIVGVLSKVQTILASKAKESREIIIKEQIEKEKLVSKEKKQLMQQLQKETLRLLASGREMPFLEQIKQYVYKIYLMINGLSVSEKRPFTEPQFYLECFIGSFRKDRCMIKLAQTDVEIKQEERPQLTQLLKVQLTDKMNLYCDITLPNEGKQYMQLIGLAIKDYYKASIKNIFNPATTDQTYIEMINKFIKDEVAISAFPSRQQKKEWEASMMMAMLTCFTEAIQRFILSCFGCSTSVSWEKEAPNSNNIESWKQSIYKICLPDQQNTSLSIMNKNAMISYTQYCQLKLITNFKFPCTEEASYLVISNNKSIYRSRNAVQQNSITVTLPLYFHSDDEDSSECQLVVRKKLDELKAIFARMCHRFISGVNTFNERFQFASAKSILMQVQKYQCLSKKNAFTRLKVMSSRRMIVQRFAQLAVLHLQTFQRKMLWHAFQTARCFSHSRYERKRYETYDNEQLSLFCQKINRIMFNSFGRLRQNRNYHQKVYKFVRSIQSFVANAEKEVKRHYFLEMNKNSRKQTNIGLFNEMIYVILLKRLFSSFYRIKGIKETKPISAVSFEQLQKCQSLSQIRQNIAIFTPQYSLFLQINEEQCFTLYSPNQQLYLAFQSIQTAYMPSDPLLSYQCGTEGQLIWNYSITNSENCFQVKDRLNSLSKCIELGVKNCRKMMELNLLKCSMFHRNWKRQLKSKFFKQWAAESKQIEMAERNRLNDSLYQVSIETQTIKQKLKTQEKILRNNHNQYRQLIKKQEEYKHQIIVSGDMIASIEQHQSKLESAKSIYHSLHRRTMLKTIFVQWRKNSSAITLLLQQQRLKNTLTFKKIAFNTLKQLFNTKKTAFWKDFLHILCLMKKKQSLPKFKGVEKIDVMFEQRSNRLVTFQSELQELENSNQHSNRSEMDDSQISYNKRKFERDRSPLQKVELSAEEYVRHNNGAYKLNPKTLKFLKRMGKLQS